MEMSDHDDADPGQDQEWLRESDLINGGLVIIGVYLVQPFLTAASLDLPARTCVVAFSVAIPLLAALVLVNRRELSRHRATRSRLVVWTRVVAQNLAFVGVVAGFWHVWWVAGVGMLAGGLVAVAVYAAGYLDLRRDQTPAAQEAGAPGHTGSSPT
jgi:protein-S-isoprenylcysteine O-methyltransferase Ste14